jgi:hypothetical protein
MEKPFNYDLDRLKECLKCPSHIMPSNMTFEEFQKWIETTKVAEQTT